MYTVVSIGTGTPLEEWLHCDKVIIYQNMKSHYFDMRNWNEQIVKHPRVRFIFIVEAKEESMVRKFMNVNRLINYSVFWDKDGVFLKDNDLESELSFVSFVVNKQLQIIEMSNPSMPGFEKTLTDLDGC